MCLWRATIKYFENESDKEAKGDLNTWLDKDTIHLTSLVADILYVYKRLHQAFQDDDILILTSQGNSSLSLKG